MNWYKSAGLHEKDIGMKREFAGLTVHVENPAGTIRMGMDHDGEEWRIDMKYDYGFLYCSVGADDEGLDVYLGPNQEAKTTYIIHQAKPDTGEYDEDKVMLGFENAKAAKKAYLDHYNSADFFGSMSQIPYIEFFELVTKGGRTKVNWKKKSRKTAIK